MIAPAVVSTDCPASPAFAALCDILADLLPKGLAIACSGGLDSRFLTNTAYLTARKRGLRPPVALHISGPHMASRESARALAWAADAGVDLRVIAMNPLGIPAVASNSRDRCYWCKKGLFEELGRQAVVLDCAVMSDGSNASDRSVYRPGMRALTELGVRSPLAEANLTKVDIHALAAESGLADPLQHPRPCLLTRLPYDIPITEPMLRELEMFEGRIESFLRGHVTAASVPDFRLRRDDEGLVLHLQPGLSPDLLAVLQALLPAVRIQGLESISGYFDRSR